MEAEHDRGLGIVFNVGKTSYFAAFDQHGHSLSNVSDFSGYSHGLKLDESSFYIVEFYKTGKRDSQGEDLFSIKDLTALRFKFDKSKESDTILNKYLELRKGIISTPEFYGNIVEHCYMNIDRFNRDLVIKH